MVGEIKKDAQESTLSIEGEVFVCTMGSVVEDDFTTDLKKIGERVVQTGVATFLLFDVQRVLSFSYGARKDIVSFLKDQRIRKGAFYGGSLFATTIVALMIRGIGLENIHFFPTKEEALLWLSS